MKVDKKTKYFLFAIILIAIMVNISFGQNNSGKASNVVFPDFTGIWLLTNSTDSIKKNSNNNSVSFLVITHQEPKLIIKKVKYAQKKDEPIVEERIYFTDGRGEKFNTSRLSPNRKIMRVSINSKTKWSISRNLEFENFININAPVGVLRERLFEKWILSDNGKTLNIEFKFFDDNENQVYVAGDVAPSRFREWTETYKFLNESDFENVRKP